MNNGTRVAAALAEIRRGRDASAAAAAYGADDHYRLSLTERVLTRVEALLRGGR
jgi:hypothetical protein